ncbi:hypothetical protein ABFS82_10G067000 [Erythranthe guttata]|uniref:Annexin n=1 Tax=Erythranthe guttata TaxID=4155 RepID=A0A022PRN0_ERYGU|nr:PREDICTED: annexin A13-like [Erythranthe guttata]EYU18179.1 hypothetical protein MIMGU_mgv1a010389mg [Erythranthe guttata]|eukprot:XP_012828680.1 PREDICTED: annexin A13-like [Erythranthe guttata]
MAVSPTTESICRKIHDSRDDEKLITQTLVNLTQPECRQVREAYKKTYGEDLIQLLSNKFDQPPPSTCLMLDPFERDAAAARKALGQNDAVAVDYKALIEILACRKSSHVLLILQAYRAKYGIRLETSIAAVEPPHPYQKILTALTAAHKAHGADVSAHIAKCDARRLYETGIASATAIDEGVVVEIFSKRSIAQLKLTFLSYNRIYGQSYTSFLKNGGFGEFEEAVSVVAKCICSPPRFYAKVLYGCLKGTTIDEGAMVRVMVSRAEVDMNEIQKEFKKKYGIELKNMICEILPHGNLRDFLVALANKTLINS